MDHYYKEKRSFEEAMFSLFASRIKGVEIGYDVRLANMKLKEERFQ
jgi:hypothetical protein